MFREMRRKKQELNPTQIEDILQRGTSGVLAVSGDDGYPYAVPISYVYRDGKLYFHCAKTGHKLDAIRRCDKASFCVIDQDHVVPEEFTTYFRSVIAFGRVCIVEDEEEKRAAITHLGNKYTPNDPVGVQKEIDREWKILCMLEMTIDHITGKEAIELMRKREGRENRL